MNGRRLLRQARKFARLATKTRAAVPREVQLEVTNRCNLDCDMCPRLTLLKVPEVDMTWETFTKVCDRLDSPESITLTGWGEPLLHPRLFDFIHEIHRRWPACDVSFTTNAHLLTNAIIDRILAANVGRVNVSLEELPWTDAEAKLIEPRRAVGVEPAAGAAPREHTREEKRALAMKGVGNDVAKDGHPTPPKVVERLRRFLDATNEQRRTRGHGPEIRMQVVLFPHGTETTLKLVDFAAEAGFHAVNLVRLDVRGRPELKRPTWEEERAMIAAARERAAKVGVPLGSVNDHGLILGVASHRDSFCVRLDNFIYVDVRGSVAPCCLLRGHKLGNLVEQTLGEIWQSEPFKQFYGPGVHPACQGCDAFLHCYVDPATAASGPKKLPVVGVGP